MPEPLWWIFTFLQNTRLYTTLNTWAATQSMTHLYMAWSHYKPAREPIYRIVRGKTVNCGYRYIWDTPIVTEQEEELDTYHHNFNLTNLPPWWHIWYYIYSKVGPYGRECQGPLTHIPPVEIPYWPKDLYIGTNLKGIFHTWTMSGPEEPQPTWIPVNAGLHSLHIWQLCPDPLAPDRTHFCIAGEAGDRVVYRRNIPISGDWIPVLTNADCLIETGATTGTIHWIANNPNHHGDFYVLFNSGVTQQGTWCIRTWNYGKDWRGFHIYDGLFNYDAGNIVAGIGQGTSATKPGYLLYAALNTGAGGHFAIYLSTDRGLSWHFADQVGISILTPRCAIDPTDQSVVYMGAYLTPDNPQELYRSIHHGTNLTEVDGDHHLGIFIGYPQADIWNHLADPSSLKILTNNHIWETANYCHTWTDHGPTQFATARMAILSPHPHNIYLARHTSAPGAPWPQGPHVFFISTNHGNTLLGKCGNHPQYDDGGGDSIPWNCGGVCQQGIMHTVIC